MSPASAVYRQQQTALPRKEWNHLFSDAASVGGLAVLARLAGAAKTVAGAWYFRPGPELDAYLLAFLLPSFLGDVFAGSIALALVPALTESSEASGLDLYAQALYRCLVLMMLLALLTTAIVFMAPIAITPQWKMARPLLLIMLPLLPVMGVMAVWRSVLYSRLQFREAAFAPILTPLITIACLPLASSLGVMVLAIGTTLGTVGEGAFLGTALWRRGILLMPPCGRAALFQWSRRAAPLQLRRTGRQYAALVAGSVMMRGSAAVDQAAAAMLGAGGLSLLNYGTRLSTVLLAVGPAAIGTTLLPRFSRAMASDNRVGLRRTLLPVLASACAFATAVTVVLIAMSQPLTRAFLLRGAFTADDVHHVAVVQKFSLMQLPFAAALAILSGVVASLKANHSMLPLWAVALAIHCALDFYFFKPLGARGVALSATIAQAFLVISLTILIFRPVRESD